MQIEVKTEDLKKVVSCTSRATANKAIQPILNNLLLECEKGSLKVLATDLDLSIECKLPAEVLEGGKITLPAKKLDEIVSKAPGEDIKLTIDKNQLTKIVSNRSKFQINGMSTDEFPETIKKIETKNQFCVSQENLFRAISLTSFATSKFESTSILSGVNLEIRDNEFEIGATDGSRLARYVGKLEENLNTSEKIQVVMPSRAVLELERLLNSFKVNNSTVNFYLLQGQIIFQNNDFTLSTRLVDGNFPNYGKLIPNEQSSKVKFSRTNLLSSLERVAILANERTNVVKLAFKKGSKVVQLSANSPDYGNATDEIDIEYKGDDLEIAFNYRYLAEALRNLEVDSLLMELENSLSPLILKINEKVDYDYTYLVMPVQLK